MNNEPDCIWEYEDSMKAYRDIKNSIDSAKQLGREEGIGEGERREKAAAARRMKADGMDAALIAKYTGLSPAEIAGL